MIPGLLVLWALTAQSPDSAAQAAVMQGVAVMADSLAALRGASAQFTRDLAGASPLLVMTRARAVRARCAAATSAATGLDTIYARHAGLVARDRGVAEWRRELAGLQGELARCEREWTPAGPASADALRAWGPHRLARLEETLRRYADAASRLPYPRAKPSRTPGVGR